MGISISNKTITPASIRCNELFEVGLALTATPDIATNPVDIMLVLDRSGSMSGNPLVALKAAAINFINIIKEATNPGGNNIGGASRIGIISFSESATLNQALTQNVAALITTINSLVANGSTNHKAAFELATTSYTPVLAPANKKILIMFTDGDTTIGGDPDSAAANARVAGIEIYAIGLGDNINVNNLNNWATDPDNTHVIIAPTPEELEQAFENLAANINTPGAIGITVVDTVENEFEIVGLPILVNPPTSTANAVIDISNKSITWTIDKLGVSTTESATLTFKVRYLAGINATIPLNASIIYNDLRIPPNQVDFTQNITEVSINCDPVVVPDCCGDNKDILFKECTNVLDIDLPSDTGSYDLRCNGRMLVLGVRLKNICPNRRIALGIIATEVINGVQYERGFKAIAVPAQAASTTETCTSFLVKPVTFIFPESLNTSSDTCSSRTFNIKIIAHYIDVGLTNFNFCGRVSN